MCLTVVRNDIPKNLFQKLFKITPEVKPLIAKKDIVCYKLYYEGPVPGSVTSFYQNTYHLVGKPQPKIILNPEKIGRYGSVRFYQGYHSFTSLPKLKKYLGEISGRNDDVFVFKCIIPKGSTYYMGNFTNTNDGYVSEQLVILEKI